MPYTVRRMNKEDLVQVIEIDHEAFPNQWPPANYKQELQNKIAHYIVICDGVKMADESPAAKMKQQSILSRLIPWKRQQNTITMPEKPAPQPYIIGFSGIWMMTDEAHITNIALRQAYRGQGLGEYLLLATIDLAQELNAAFLTLEVRASNIVAQSLYSKYGFMQMGVRKGYYLDNREDAIVMSTEGIKSDGFQARISKLREDLRQRPG